MKFINALLLSLALMLTGCSGHTQTKDPIPSHEDFSIQSAKLGEPRKIFVWKPESYETGSEALPVIYMADGGLQEDFPHIANTLDKTGK